MAVSEVGNAVGGIARDLDIAHFTYRFFLVHDADLIIVDADVFPYDLSRSAVLVHHAEGRILTDDARRHGKLARVHDATIGRAHNRPARNSQGTAVADIIGFTKSNGTAV